MSIFESVVEQGLCAQTNPDVFFPDKGASNREAKKVCARCPVLTQCREFAVATPELTGVWGGLSNRERRNLRRAQRRAA
jgi:WhiB family redox-sensing transcriptional regulator